MKPVIMSMSGIRGVVGEGLEPALALKMGMAFGGWVGKGPVIVGGDTRTSHDMIKSALISGLTAVGTDVMDIGRVPTPTVQQMIRRFNAKGGLVVTASHNPVIWNGIKVMNGTGSFLEDAEYESLMALFNGDHFELASWQYVGQLNVITDANNWHVQHILNQIDASAIQTSGLRVLIDANHGAGSVVDPILMQALGVETTLLNSEPHGRFAHDPEPLEKNLSGIIEELKTGNYDIGFVQDADADRLVILDEKGRFIGEDYSLGLCIDAILSGSKVADASVVVNLSTSQIIDHISAKHGAKVVHTKIGETHVTQAIKRLEAVVGGEGNGGVIYPKVGWGRDSLVGIVIALKYLAESKKTVSQWVAEQPKFVMLREKMAVSSQAEVRAAIDQIVAKFPDAQRNTDDGVKLMFDQSWLHVRPSNTEPIVRLFIEAPTADQAKALLDHAMGH